MRRVKIIAGTIWALLAMILIVMLFPELNVFSGSVAKLPFMKLNPNYSGGEIAKQIVSEIYTIDIRKPVFDGLTGQKKEGFVQVDWRGKLPETISDTIDYDLDQKPDFLIKIKPATSKTEFISFNEKAGDIRISTPTSYGWAIRVNVKK
jgi:hypothetical protein